MKGLYVKNTKVGDKIDGLFMVMKVLQEDDGGKVMAYIGDNTGDIKASINSQNYKIKNGDVFRCKGIRESIVQVEYCEKIKNYSLEDFLPICKTPVEDMLNEMENISRQEFKSKEVITLDKYFFQNKEFLNRFKKGIGGVSQHHNYIGGLVEHTLNVMYLTKILAYRYDCRYKDLAILAAKLHDMGKIYEYYYEGPFSFTLRGEMEGHIVIGITMLEEAFKAGGEVYSEEFKKRMKGCIVQHHGKLEYGSPKAPNTQEAYIVHYADYVDATLNKVCQVKEGVKPNTWSNYDRRLEGKLYI